MQLKPIIFFVWCFLSCITSYSQQAPKPNFVFILTDDQSYGMMGCTGNGLAQTPSIDRLATEGVLFTNAYITSAICTPSRASILLSEYERKHGINFNSGTSMDTNAWDATYPLVMRRNGYYTGWIGKNHVPVGEGGYSSGIMEKSFDYWYGGHGHLKFYPKEHHDIFRHAEADTQAEIISEGVQDFLSNEQKLESVVKFLDQRPKNKPFALTVCFNLPHGAGTSTMRLKESDDEIYKSLFRDQEIPMPAHYIAKADITHPKLPLELLRAEDRQMGYNYVDTPDTNKERIIRMYQAMKGIDRMVGELRAKLREEKLDKNTVIVFSSDHGLFMGQFGLGGKALCYEITTHVPLIIYDPLSKKSLRGKRSEALVQSIDIAPTMLSMAGIHIPGSYQGKSLEGLLKGLNTEVREYVFTENLWSTHFGNPRCEAVQNKKWKYIRYYRNQNFSARKKIEVAQALDIDMTSMLYKIHDQDIAVYRSYIESPLNGERPVFEELYNLENDPDETTNLADDPDFQGSLERMRGVWASEIKMARGAGKPRVLRYTADSEAERGLMIEPK